MKNTKVFKEFEYSFRHLFDECERGFTNELIIKMFCQIFVPGKDVCPYKCAVKEMYFVRQGMIECFNNPNDELIDHQPIFYLP